MIGTSQAGPRGAFSAETELWLISGGVEVELLEIGPGFISLKRGVELSAGPATILAVVDGRKHVWNVILPDDLVPWELEVAVPSLGEASLQRHGER